MLPNSDIGVVIPTHNRAELTARAVDSILNQVVKPRQIVIVDDGSSKIELAKLKNLVSGETIQIIESEAVRHPGILRNIGVRLLHTNWVAFLDSDDVWLPDKLLIQLAYAEANKAEAICSNGYLLEEKIGPIEYLKINNANKIINTKQLLRKNLIINSSVLIKKDLLESIGGVSESYLVRGVEDYATWLRVSTKVKWHLINQPLVKYNSTQTDSISHTFGYQHYSFFSAILDFKYWQYKKSLFRRKLFSITLKFVSRL